MAQTWLYEAWRGEEYVVGTARELTEATGMCLNTVKDLANSGNVGRRGWRVRRVSNGLKYVAYSATKTAEGTAREVADAMGISVWSVQVAAHDGKPVGQRATGHGIIVNYKEDEEMSMIFIPNLYRAVRGSETHYGNADEIGRLAGILPGQVPKTTKRLNNVTRTGWTISRVLRENAPDGYRNRAAQNYIATKDGEDPIMGDAWEVAALIGTFVTNVRKAESEGRTAKGWHIRKASDEEVAEFERQWA